MSHKGYGVNEYGTRVSLHVCDKCGLEFTIVPAQLNDDFCGFKFCESYDAIRDVDELLANDLVKVEKRELQ